MVVSSVPDSLVVMLAIIFFHQGSQRNNDVIAHWMKGMRLFEPEVPNAPDFNLQRMPINHLRSSHVHSTPAVKMAIVYLNSGAEHDL